MSFQLIDGRPIKKKDSVWRPSADNHTGPSRDFQIEHSFPPLKECPSDQLKHVRDMTWACYMTKHCTDWKTLDLFVAVPFSTLKCRQNQIVGLGNQLHGIQAFRLTLGDTWGGFRGHLGTLGVGLGDTWGHLGWEIGRAHV